MLDKYGIGSCYSSVNMVTLSVPWINFNSGEDIFFNLQMKDVKLNFWAWLAGTSLGQSGPGHECNSFYSPVVETVTKDMSCQYSCSIYITEWDTRVQTRLCQHLCQWWLLPVFTE